MPDRRAVFFLDLLQDVNILRPLMSLCAKDLGAAVEVLMSSKFVERDARGAWQAELGEIAEQLGFPIHVFSSDFEAFRLLQGKSGALLSSSETSLSAHGVNHGVFLTAPPSYVRITVQHGFECVGFLQSREHDKAHGINTCFAADVVCGWFELPTMTAMPSSERSKLYVTGPTAVLATAPDSRPAGRSRQAMGLVCENLHSVRLRASGDVRQSFLQTFMSFCEALDADGDGVTLRPHPATKHFGGENPDIPRNVRLDARPSYKVSFSEYAYGISAPSSVLIDMMLAGIPVAVWRDEAGVFDAGNYAGLHFVSSTEDWLRFRESALTRPESVLESQRSFLSRTGMPLEPAVVRERFRRLLASATEARGHTAIPAPSRRTP